MSHRGPCQPRPFCDSVISITCSDTRSAFHSPISIPQQADKRHCLQRIQDVEEAGFWLCCRLKLLSIPVVGGNGKLQEVTPAIWAGCCTDSRVAAGNCRSAEVGVKIGSVLLPLCMSLALIVTGASVTVVSW